MAKEQVVEGKLDAAWASKEKTMGVIKEYEVLWLNVVLLQDEIVRTSPGWEGVDPPESSSSNELEWDWMD